MLRASAISASTCLASLEPGAAYGASEAQIAACAAWNQAMKQFFAADWTGAAQAFRDYLAAWGEDGPARLYLDRAESYIAAPPEESWDGVLRFEGK